MQLLIGVLLVLLLVLIALGLYWLLKRYRNAQHIRPTRTCPFCEDGTLSMQPGTRVARQRGRATVWYYTWKCDRCNYWDVADVLGNVLPEQQQGE